METKKSNIMVKLPYTILGVIMVCMILTGCDLREPTAISPNRIQVEQETFSETLPVAQLNEAGIRGLANHYRKHGDGPVDLTVTYDPVSRTGGAMQANDEMVRIVNEMRAMGIHNVQAGILPVAKSNGQMNAMVSYTSYNALAPKDCTLLPGVKEQDNFVDRDYKLGCTRDTLFAKQIARPKDLAGRDEMGDTTDGRRAANVVDVYRTGAPNEPLEGESASDE